MVLSKKLEFWLDFLRAMTIKEIKARYKRAILGFLHQPRAFIVVICGRFGLADGTYRVI